MMNTEIASVGWAIELVGAEEDIGIWRSELEGDFDPYVEDIIDKECKTTVLKSEKFPEGKTPVELLEIADDLVAKLNGAFFLKGQITSVRSGAAIQLMSDGSVRRHIVVKLETGQMNISGMNVTVQVFDKDGNLVVQPPEPSFAQKAIRLAEKNDLLGDALKELSHASDWHSLYRAYDMLNDNKLADDFHSDAEKTRFRRTANGFGIRHRPRKFTDIKDPMNLPEARVFIRDWLTDALDQSK